MLKRIFLGVIVISTISLALVGCCPKSAESLPVTLHPQETGMWCWAASGKMVMHYLGHNISQCVQANNRFGVSNCCTVDLCPPPTQTACPCACGGWPEFAKYDFSFSTTSNAPLSWSALKSQISRGGSCKGTPFCFSWHWNGGGGHMMVAIGYKTVDGVNWVEVNDPWAPCFGDHKFITYDRYVEGPGYTHWNDYYNINYTGD